MADIKVSQLSEATSIAGTDLIMVVQDGVSKKASISLTTNAQAASDILTKIKTVDGAGSGLDADLLDGQQGSYFQPAATAITTSNIAAQNVNSAVTAGTASTASNANALNGQAGSWYTPPGAVMSFAMASAPLGWLKANGQALSRSTYAALFAAIGTLYGAGDGSSTFNLPDLRGEFIRGWDDARGVDSGRVLGSWQKGSAHSIDSGTNAAVIGDRDANTTDPATVRSNLGYDAGNAANYAASVGQHNVVATSGLALADTSDGVWGVTRPRNTALLICIKF